MSHRYSNIGDNYEESAFPYSSILALKERMNKPILGRGWEELYGRDIPAWSLHRLLELAYGNWKEDVAPIYLGNSYDMLIGRIEFQIKQGKINKEYLV